MRSVLSGAAAAIVFASAPGFGADATAGKALFRQQCSICHSAEPGDNGGAQGPTLVGVYGRHAAGAAGFSYTAALRAADLTWDAPALNRFLASPSTVVPGSAMLIAVPGQTDRDDLVAYFQSLAGKSSAAGAAAQDGGARASAVPDASRLSADWKLDAPGRAHRIDLAALPAPFSTASSRNSPEVVARPANASLALPPGFRIDVFADNLKGPRRMLVAPNGDILLSEILGGRVSVLHPAPDGSRAASVDIYLEGLRQPFGLAFYPNAASRSSTCGALSRRGDCPRSIKKSLAASSSSSAA